MKYTRVLFLALLPVIAGNYCYSLESLEWNAPGYSSEFKYFQDSGIITPEKWAGLTPEAQQRELTDAKGPALQRRQEIGDYWAAVSRKWNSEELGRYTGAPQDSGIRAVNIWLGKERAEALAKKLALVKLKMGKAAQGLSDRDVRELGPYLTPEAIEELRAPREEGGISVPSDISGVTPPAAGQAAALSEFAGKNPSALNADSLSKFYDGAAISGKQPVVAGGTLNTTKGAPTAVVTVPAAQNKTGTAVPQPSGQPSPAAVDNKSTAWTSDAYGFTVTANGQTQTFRDQKQAETAIRALPDGSITKIILYGHGSPGMQTVGPATYDAMSAGTLLRGKMARNGVIQFSGCNTASIGGTTLNPAVGLSMAARRLLYFSLPYFQDRLDGVPADQARLQWEREWNRDLARETSEYVKDSVVCGYRTFGLVPGRLPVITRIFGTQEAATPGVVAGKKACYKNGQEVPAR